MLLKYGSGHKIQAFPKWACDLSQAFLWYLYEKKPIQLYLVGSKDSGNLELPEAKFALSPLSPTERSLLKSEADEALRVWETGTERRD